MKWDKFWWTEGVIYSWVVRQKRLRIRNERGDMMGH